MNLLPLVPKRLQKPLLSFPQKEKEIIENYLLRLKKHIETLKNDKQSKIYLKLYDFLNIMVERNGGNMNIEKMALLEQQLVPKNENLYKAKQKRNKSLLAKSSSFEILEPLKDATSLVKYYRLMIKKTNTAAKFEENAFVSECRFAAQILDDINSNNRDEKFLRMWIYNYITNSLKGDNITKTEKTSIYAFRKTFNTFNVNYYG